MEELLILILVARFFVTPSRHKGYERLLHGESKYGQ